MQEKAEFSGFNRRVFAIALVVLIGAQALLARPIFETLMLESARTPSARWATLFLDEVSLSLSKRSDDQAEFDPGHHAVLIGSLSAALTTTTVHQVDIVRLDCMCAVSIGQGLFATNTDQDGISISGALERVLDGRIPDGKVVGFGNELIEMDAVLLDQVAATGRPELSLLAQPELASAVFYAAQPGQPAMIVRLIMDLTDGSSIIKMLLALLGIVVTSVSMTVVVLAYRAVRKSKAQGEMSAEQARFLAERDPLTGLFNRLGFRNRASVLLERCNANGHRACLIQYDANNLKSINDLHGHPTGDRCLIDIADQIRASFPEEALMARLGSDEFAVLIEEQKLPKEIGSLKAEAVDAAAKELAVSTTVGFAFYPDDGPTLYQLMKAADLALISAKSLSRDSVVAYSRSMSDSFRKKAWEIQGIRDAIIHNEIEPYYQPLVNAQTLQLEGVETLVRWNHPELGTLRPASFESALADPAIAVAVTETVLDLLLKDLKSWWTDGHRFFAGLNVGEFDLRHPGLSDMILEKLNQHDLPPAALTIEVTESAVNGANVHAVLPILQSFRDRGFSVALDDFGTGTSSLTLLRTLPRTAIKIDKSFVADIVHDPEDHAIVQSLTQLGRDLNIKVVAEGVETDEQVELLRNLGVDVFQGYLFGKPQTGTDISRNLRHWEVAPFHRNQPGPPPPRKEPRLRRSGFV